MKRVISLVARTPVTPLVRPCAARAVPSISSTITRRIATIPSTMRRNTRVSSSTLTIAAATTATATATATIAIATVATVVAAAASSSDDHDHDDTTADDDVNEARVARTIVAASEAGEPRLTPEQAKKLITERLLQYAASAEAGDADSQYRLGEAFAMWPGGVPEAIKWMTLAADQNYTPAIARLQLMYYQGKLVPRNLPKAIELMKRGVELNDPSSMLLLAMCMMQGTGLPRDVMGAIPIFEKTVNEFKQAAGARLLFYIYEHGVRADGTIRSKTGNGVTSGGGTASAATDDTKLLLAPSPQLSRYWLKQAAELGDGDSQWAYTIRCLQAARRAEGAEVAGRRATGAPSATRAYGLRDEAATMLSLHLRHSLSQRIGRDWDDTLYSGALQSIQPMRELHPAVWMWAQLGKRGVRTPGAPTPDECDDLLDHLRAIGYQPPETMIAMLPPLPSSSSSSS